MLVHSFEATILGPLILFNSSWNTFVIPSVYLQEKYKPHVQTRPDQTCHTKVVTKNDNEYKEGPSWISSSSVKNIFQKGWRTVWLNNLAGSRVAVAFCQLDDQEADAALLPLHLLSPLTSAHHYCSLPCHLLVLLHHHCHHHGQLPHLPIWNEPLNITSSLLLSSFFTIPTIINVCANTLPLPIVQLYK